MNSHLPPPVRLLVDLAWRTDWRVFAAISASLALLVALPLLLYPDVYSVGRNYDTLKSWAPQATWGMLLGIPALVTLGFLHRPVARLGILGVMVALGVITAGFLLSVGPSPASLLHCANVTLAFWAYVRSGRE